MRRRITLLLAGAALGAICTVLRADDSDIYVGRVAAPLAEPLVMFSVDTSTDMGAAYGGCNHVGVGLSLCASARYFKDNCPTCVLPAADSALTYYDAVRYIVRMVLLEVRGVKVGLMLNHGHEPNCAGPRSGGLLSSAQRCSNGAYVARQLKTLDSITVPLTGAVLPGANTAEFLNILDGVPISSSTNHSYQGKELFFELFRYLTGQGIYNGHNGYSDYGTNNLQNLNVDNTGVDWDTAAELPLLQRYLSPLTTDLGCGKIFTINFLGRPSRQDSDSDDAIQAASGGMTGINLAGSANSLSTLIGYLHDVDLARNVLPFGAVPELEGKQNVTSYFVAIPSPRNSNPPSFDNTTTQYALQGGTTAPLPLSENPEVLLGHLRSILSQVLSISTTFVSSSVPVNVFNRTQVLNEIYLSLFQADIVAKPFWPGNVKKLKLKPVSITCAAGDTGCEATSGVQLTDALGVDAVAPDGRIHYEALTYWTDPSRVAANATKGVVAGRDGRHVEQGGAGQKIPGFISGAPGNSNSDAGARQLYVYAATGAYTAAEAGATLTPLSADATLASALQVKLEVSDSLAALKVLKYLRGFDSYDADGDLNLTEVRPWLMGDPMHSKPLPINYGAIGGHTRENPAIYIAVGTNQGFLHFIRNTTTSGTESGAEAWALLPLELLGVQDKLARNVASGVRIYGFDGAPTSYIHDVDGDGNIEATDGDKVYLYAGLRRGGKAYYALDVTDPLAPRFLWKIDPARLGFAGLGYAFSQPRIGRVQTGVDVDGNAVIRPAVFFGGGYDTNKDYTAADLALFKISAPTPGSVGRDDSIGNALYVVDAETGALIWRAVGPPVLSVLAGADTFVHAGLVDSIPSTLTVVDTDGSGTTDRVVVGDTGGNVWRADLKGLPSDWKLTLLAKLGRHNAAGKANDRRFFHESDFVLSRDEYGPFDAVVIGSGDREDPLDYGRARSIGGVETFTENAIFMLKDRRVSVGGGSDADPATPSRITDVTANCLQVGVGADCPAPDLRLGWRIRLLLGKGEKALASPLTAANRVYLTSYLPPDRSDTTSCGPSEGGGLFYSLGLKTGAAAFNYNTADGGTENLPNSAADRFDPLASAGIPSEPVFINLPTATGGESKCILGSDLQCRHSPGAMRFRTFWQKVE